MLRSRLIFPLLMALFMALNFFSFTRLNAQEASQPVRLFVDCSFCSLDFFRQNLEYVDYVRERQRANVHLIASRQRTAARGHEVLYEFIGQGQFAGLSDTLRFVISLNTSEQKENEELARQLEKGLLLFLAQTPLREFMSFEYSGKEPTTHQANDPWRNWVFTITASGSFRKEALYRASSLRSTFLARKVTPDIRLQSYNYLGLDEGVFDTGDGEVQSISRELYSSNVGVISMSDHWSYGGEVEFRSSYFDNLKWQNRYWLALEYNLFPYSESSRRQLRFTPELGYDYRHYHDTTIYNQIREGFFVLDFLLAFNMKETWGEAYAHLEAVSFLNNLSRYELNISAGVSLNLVKGLSLNLSADGALLRNQVGLPGAGLSKEEVLLQQRQQATDFRIRTRLGFSYTFGSIYNNVVNPRFGF